MKKLILFFIVAMFFVTTNALAQDSIIEKTVFSKNTLNVCPNPSDGPFTVYLNSPEKTFSITIYSIVGKIIYDVNDLPSNLGVIFEPIEKGLYFYIATCDKNNYRGKLVIN